MGWSPPGGWGSGSRGICSWVTNAPQLAACPLCERYCWWKSLCQLPRWLDRTLRNGYVLQFHQKPPSFQKILWTVVASPEKAAILEIDIFRGAVAILPGAKVDRWDAPYPQSGFFKSPHCQTRVVEAALLPLRRQGVRVLTYLDDLVILAPSERETITHSRLLIDRSPHDSGLGNQLGQERPSQTMVYLGIQLNTIDMKARLSEPRRASVAKPLNHFNA